MKATKRIASLALAVLMLLSCAAFVGCEGTLGYFTERKMKEAYIEAFNIQGVDADDVVLDYYAGKYGDLQIAMLDAECHDPAMWIETIGGTQIIYYDSNRLLAWDGESLMTLTEARDGGRLTSDDIASIAAKFNGDVKHFYDTGDTFDYDDKIYTEIPASFWILHPMPKFYHGLYSKLYYRDYLTSNLSVIVDDKLSCDEDDLRKILKDRYDISAEVVRVSTKENKYSLGFDFDNAISLLYMKSRLYEIPGITKVYLEPFIMPHKNSNDSYYYYDNENNEQWALQYIGVENIWDFYEGSKAVRVGILDLGVYNHVDLVGNLGVGRDCKNITDSNINTITDDTDSDHGTLIAGIIGGVGNNGIGITGVNWRITIIPLQVQGSNGSYNVDATNKALEYAHDSYGTSTPISILNISLWNGFRHVYICRCCGFITKLPRIDSLQCRK